MITFKEFMEGHDKKNFPKVDRDYKVYSKLSKKTLKKVASKYKVDPKGSKGGVLRNVLARLDGDREVSGYYNKVGHDDFPKVKAREKAKQAFKAGTAYDKEDDK